MNLSKLPLSKDDVQYDAAKGEVSLRREKFDQLMRFVQGLMAEAQEAEDARDTARARLRRARVETNIVTAYASVVAEAKQKVRQWLDENTIQELVNRTKIPYATCYRIVHERLPQSKVDLATFGEILKVADEPAVQKSNEIAR